MKLVSLVALTVPLALTVSCAQQVCEKQFACQEELGLSFDDDYVQVCVAAREGNDKVLRANAEPACDDLATALQALGACEAALPCEDLAASTRAPRTDDDKCKDLRKAVDDAFAEADNGLACDGIADNEGPADTGAAEGEGEGEGEGESN